MSKTVIKLKSTTKNYIKFSVFMADVVLNSWNLLFYIVDCLKEIVSVVCCGMIRTE